MYTARTPLLATLVFSVALPLAARGQSTAPMPAARRQLEHEDYDRWSRIAGQALSADGGWLLYTLTSEARDPVLHVKAVSGTTVYTVERGEDARFSDDASHVVFRLKPYKEAVKRARQEKKKPDEMPQDSIGILSLRDGGIVRAARLRSFRVPERAGGWVAYHLAKEPGASPARPDSAAAPQPRTGAAQKKKEDGTTLVLRNLASGEDRRIANVVSYEFSKDGARLVYATSTQDGAGDGVYALETSSGELRALMEGKGDYKGIAIDDSGRQVAFLSSAADPDTTQPAYTVYHWQTGARAGATAVASSATAGVPAGWWVSEHATPSFSDNGQRLFFGTSPRPEPAPADTANDGEEKVVLDVWSWTDPLLQPMQLKQLEQERRRTYQAVVHLRDNRVVQLATAEVPDITLGARGDADIALGRSALPYRQEVSWGESGADYYVVDLRTGTSEKVLEYVRSNVALSAAAKYASWFDGENQRWYVMDLRTRSIRDVSGAIPHPVHNELHDAPSLPGPYGSGGWTEDDAELLIYDQHDVWAVDPTGRAAPRNVTDGLGRRENLRLRVVDLNPRERAIDPAADLLLSAFDLWTKDSGFYRDRVRGGGEPVRLSMADRSFGMPRKAERGDVVVLTRSSFREFPDLYISDLSFTDLRRISEANPHQSEYRWGTAELVDWRSSLGEVLQGVLYKPEDFDPSHKYPMMVYFYERLSNNLHNHFVPAADRASINISFYVSRGYLVFTPDIPYRVGYPGESAMNAVVPGVLSLLERGFVDPQRVGVQGHSWGGYQIAYMITKTNLFAAAEAGAPVANMISAYGGIRWGTGMSRMFQYEKTQSRIGGTLWEAPLHFIENSPIFWAQKVETPLLMMHNDEDGAVPWEQGIEYFVALRRLQKPVWMLNYNGEDHGLTKEHNRKDWAIRMQQFFDHYLLDAPPPVWMVQGVPALDKGRTMGLELIEQEPRAVTEQAVSAGNGRH